MAGVNLYKRGRHPTRESSSAEVSGIHSQRVIATLLGSVREHIPTAEILHLLTAIAQAAIEHQKLESPHTPSPCDVRRQLKSMLLLEDDDLNLALKTCDASTFEKFNRALNYADVDWVRGEGGCEYPGPLSKRWAVARALEDMQQHKRGRKPREYQLKLALECTELFHRHQGKNLFRFAKAVFEAAGMRHFERKRLEQILTNVKKPRARSI